MAETQKMLSILCRDPQFLEKLSHLVSKRRVVRVYGRGSGGPPIRFEPALGCQEGFDHIIPEHDQGGHRPQTLRYSFIPA